MSEVEPDELLWKQFAEARMKEGNLNDHLDLPCIFSEIPPGFGSAALDLGCGLGQSSFLLAEKLGYDVLAVDASAEMLDHARKLYSGSNIQWIESTFETLRLPPNSVNLIVACLSFHFVENLEDLLKRCGGWLCEGGSLVFSVRHPIRTCNPTGETISEGQISWTVKDYFTEGPREFSWLGAPCINFHRTIGNYTRMLLQAGLTIEKIIEPCDGDGSSSLAVEGQSVPFFLTVSCRKSRGSP
jgi:ubiquinone/menaquinone biosynthesis C-methylase UbiE